MIPKFVQARLCASAHLCFCKSGSARTRHRVILHLKTRPNKHPTFCGYPEPCKGEASCIQYVFSCLLGCTKLRPNVILANLVSFAYISTALCSNISWLKHFALKPHQGWYLFIRAKLRASQSSFIAKKIARCFAPLMLRPNMVARSYSFVDLHSYRFTNPLAWIKKFAILILQY